MPSRPRAKAKLVPLSDNANDIFARILAKCGLTEQSYRLKIFLAWEQAVGPSIAARTAVLSYGRGILVVKAATSTWQHELMFLRRTILDKINGLMHRRVVHELRVVSGHLPRKRIAPFSPTVAPSPTDYAVAKDTSLPIADPDVRAAFESLMAKDRRFKTTQT